MGSELCAHDSRWGLVVVGGGWLVIWVDGMTGQG